MCLSFVCDFWLLYVYWIQLNCTILSIPFCPYHFVQYLFVHTILSVPFCPLPFYPVTSTSVKLLNLSWPMVDLIAFLMHLRCLSVYLSFCPSVRPPIHPSIHISIYLVGDLYSSPSEKSLEGHRRSQTDHMGESTDQEGSCSREWDQPSRRHCAV